jgi:predicted phosphodiesterase
MTAKMLVMGDNHGGTESLERVLADTEGESFDLAVHVGDFTCAWRESRQRDDEQAGKDLGVEQLRDVEPLLESIADRTEHGLLWVYGNQDYFGELDYDLSVGTEIPDDGHVETAGFRFTNAPDLIEPGDVLVSHLEHWRLVDNFEGLAHFCGNSHRGRHYGRRLNSSFLELDHPETGETHYGGYFVVDLAEELAADDDGVATDDRFDVELRAIGDLERHVCDRHADRGVQFQPSRRPCMFCEDDRVLMREMASSAFYALTEAPPRWTAPPLDSTDSDAQATESSPPSDSPQELATAGVDEVVEHALDRLTDPPSGFRENFEDYLRAADDDRYGPLTRMDDGRLAVAERSYAY